MKGLLLRLAWQEVRGHRGRFLFLILALAVGFAAHVATAGFAQAVLGAVQGESRALLGGDLVVSSRSRGAEDLEGRLKGLPLAGQVLLVEGPTMVQGAQGRTRLVELRAVSGPHPLAGVLRTSPERAGGSRGLLVDRSLAAAWGLRPAGPGDPESLLARGEALRLGDGIVPIRALILQDDSQQAASFALGPRIYLDLEQARTLGLVTSRSRLVTRLLLSLPKGIPPVQVAAALKTRLPEGWTVRTHEEAGTALARPLMNLNRFVGLLGLATLILATLGAYAILTAYLESRTREVAILRCLGAAPWRPVAAYALVAGGLVGLALLLGFGMGMAGAALLPRALVEVLPPGIRLNLTLPSLADVSPVIGALALLLVPPLRHLALLRPLALLRDGPEPRVRPDLKDGACLMGALGLTGLVVVRQAPSLGVGLATAGTLALLFLTLFGAARLLVMGYRKAGGRLPLALRLGLGQLGVRPALSALLMAVMGLAVFLVLASQFLKDDILAPLAFTRGDGTRANLFLVDVPPEAEGELVDHLAARCGNRPMVAPVVRARLVSVAGQPVAGHAEPPGKGEERHMATREQNLSWRQVLASSEQVVAGRYWPADGVPRQEASLEEGFAGRIGAHLGDELVFDVSGQPVRATVTSLRKVRWTSFQVNFFILLHPSLLEGAPATRIMAVEADDPAGREALKADVARRFPTVTLVDVAELVDKAGRVVDLVARVARVLAALMLGSALLVLSASLLAGRMGRARDLAILRALGASESLVVRSLAWEFLVLGGTAAGTAAGFAWVAARLYARRVLELDSHPSMHLVLGVTVASALLTWLVGWAGSRRALAHKPLDVLRGE